MKDTDKTKSKLISEIRKLRQENRKFKSNGLDVIVKERKENEKSFKILYENIPLPYQSLDKKGNYIEINKAWCKIFKYRRSEVIGRNFSEFLTSDSIKQYKKNFRYFKQKGSIENAELDVRKKNGAVVSVSINGKISYDNNGSFKQTHCILNDITKQKKTEEENTLLAQTLKSAKDCISITDLKNNLIFVNEAFLSIYGYTKEEILGKSITVVRSPEESTDLDNEIVPATLKDGWHGELINRKKNGVDFPIEIWTTVVKDISEVPIALVGIARDITERNQAEKALKEEKEYYREFVESMDDWVWEIDAQGNYTYSNDAVEKILGYKVDEVIGTNSVDLWLEEEKTKRNIEWLKRMLSSGKGWKNYETVYKHKDGSEVWTEATGIPIYNSDNELTGYRGIDRDITRRKAVETALKISRERLTLALEGTGLGSWDHNYKTGEIVRNERWAEILGYTLDELKPSLKFWKDLIHPDDLQQVMEIMECCEEGKTEDFKAEYRMRTKNGEWRWILDWGKIIERDNNGKPLRAAGTHLDITERKQAEENLQESEEQFRLAFENSNVGMCLVDPDGRLTRVNSRMCEIFGYSQEELESITVNDIAHPEDTDISPKFIKRATSGEIEHTQFEKRYFHKRGHIVWGQVSSSLVRGFQGEPLYFISHVQDITERKRAEENLQKSEKRFRFLFEKNLAAVYQTSLDGAVLDCNQSFADLLGYDSPEEVKKHDANEFYFKKSNRELFINNLKEEGVLVNREFKMRRKDGLPVWIIENVNLIEEENSNLVIQGTAIGITERIRVEEKNIKLMNQQIAINKLSLALGDTRNLKKIYVIVYKHLTELLSTDIFIISSYNSTKKTISAEYVTNIGDIQDVNNYPTLPLAREGKGIQSEVIRTGKPVYISDWLNEAKKNKTLYIVKRNGSIRSGFPEKKEESESIRSAIFVPMKIAGEVKGVMQLQSVKKDDYSLEDIELLSGMANVAAIAIQNVGLYYEIKEELTERKKAEKIQSVLYKISKAVNTASDLDELYELIRKYLGEIMDTENFYIALYNKETGSISLPFFVDEKDNYRSFPAGKTLTAYVIKNEKPLLANTEVIDELTQSGEIETIGALSKIWLGVPLKVENEVIGLIAVQSYTDPNLYSERDMNILELISEEISHAIIRKRIESQRDEMMKELKESEERLALTIESAELGIWDQNFETGKVIRNEVWAKMLGYGPGEIKPIIESWKDMIHPDDVERAKRAIEEHENGITKEYRVEHRLRAKNGEWKWILDWGRIVERDKDGRPVRALGTHMDITEHRQAEDRIKRFAQIFEDSLNEIYLFDADTLKFTQVNNAAQNNLGYTMEELQKLTPLDLKPEFTTESYAKLVAPLRKGEKEKIVFETVHKRKDQSLYDVEVHLQFLKQEHKALFAAIILDITERKQAEEELRESEEKHRTLFETMIQGVVYQDADGKIISANSSAERILGLTFDQMQGRTSLDPRWKSIHEDGSDFPGETHPSMIALKTGQTVSNTIMGIFHPKEEEYRWININAIPQFKPGEKKSYQVYTTFQDITERKQAEKALQESEKRYRTIFDNTMDVFYRSDSKGNLIMTNSAGLKLFGYKKLDEMIGKNLEKDFYYHSKDRKKTLETLKKNNGKLELYQLTLKKKDGTPIIIETNSHFIFDDKGKPIGTEGLLRDITERKRTEDMMRESEEKYRSLVESTEDSIYLVNKECEYLFMNNKNLSRLGTPLDQLIGKKYSQSHSKKNTEIFQKKISKVFKTGESLTYEHQSERDGKSFLRTLSPVKDERGKIVSVTVISKDITVHKQMEEELRKSEEQYRDLVEKAGIAILIDDEEGKFKYYNDKFAELYGYSSDEIKTHSLKKLIHPDDFNIVMGHHKKRIKGKSAPTRYEFRGIRENGDIIYLETDVIPYVENNKIVGTRSYVWDITERKRAEEALRKSEEQYKDLVEKAGVAIVTDDEEGAIKYYNKKFNDLFGYTRAELKNHSLETLVHQGDIERVLDYHRSRIKGKTVPNRYDFRGVRKNGKIIYLEADVIPYIENNKVVGTRSYIWDITERKKAEEELRKYSESQKVLIREINHRVRNNLTAIISMLYSEQDIAEKKGKLEYLPSIHSLVMRVKGLSTVHSMLSESEWKPLKITQLCERIVNEVIRSVSSSKDVNLSITPSDTLIGSSKAHYLGMVINELTTNSLKYAYNNKDKLNINIDIDEEDDNIVLRYRDDGPGYPQEIFKEGFSKEGIGFELIQGIVRQSLLGRLKIKNENGAVTTIIFKNN